MKEDPAEISDALEENRRKWDLFWRDNLKVQPPSRSSLIKRLTRFYKHSGSGELVIRLVKREALGGQVVLEAGSGSGDIALRLAEKRNRVYIIDTSFYAVQTCARSAKLNGLTVIPLQASIFHLPFKDASFDFIYNVGVIDHFPPEKRIEALREMLRLVPPGKCAAVISNDSRSRIHPLAYNYAKKQKKWPFGDKFAIASLAEEIDQIDFEVKLKEYSRGFVCQFEFLRYFLPDKSIIKRLFHWSFFLIALPLTLLNYFPGQFRISVMKKAERSNDS